MEKFEGQYKRGLMCRVLKVTVQGYHQWRNRSEARSERLRKEAALRTRIRIIHAESRRTYGRIRVTEELRAQGFILNEKHIGRLMKVEGLRAKAARKFKATTDSGHTKPVAENVLNREFTATAPNQKWVGDITYIWTAEGWLSF